MDQIIFFIVGACGAIAKDIIEGNKLKLPRVEKNNFCLGFLGGTLIGGISGILADANPVNAFLAGYAGTSLIENITPDLEKKDTKKIDIVDLIRTTAKKKGVDPDLAERVAKCESSLNPNAINLNKNGTRDRGLYQINDYWHSNVTDQQAFDPQFSVNYFCDRVLQGKLTDWKASEKCWLKKD